MTELKLNIGSSQPSTINLLDLSPAAMISFFETLGEKKFRTTQVLQWIYQKRILDFDQMTNLSKSCRERLKTIAEIRLPKINREHVSVDGTHKWLIGVDEINQVETVYIPDTGRGTLCVSSQVGCSLNCTFCSTATQGFSRNLTVAEIVGQVWLAKERLAEKDMPLTNVVMMGMGEPLLNYENCRDAMELMMHDLAFGLSRRRVTLSTSGVVPGIDRLTQESDASLAVSLHAPNDELRCQLVPINKKYSIQELLEACDRFVHSSTKSKRHITYEYVMLDGINDSDDYARRLVKLMKNRAAKVNLIPFNPFPGSSYRTSSDARIASFKAVLTYAGVVTTVRRTRGDDIGAACGQLVGEFKDRTRRREKMSLSTSS